MTITLTPDIETGLIERAQAQGKTPETLALERLREEFAAPGFTESDPVYPPKKYTVKTIPLPQREPIPHDEWVRLLRSIGTDCGVSLTDEQVSREALYDDHL